MSESGTSIIINAIAKKIDNGFVYKDKKILEALIHDRMNIETMKFILLVVSKLSEGEVKELVDKLDKIRNDLDLI